MKVCREIKDDTHFTDAVYRRGIIVGDGAYCKLPANILTTCSWCHAKSQLLIVLSP